MGACRPSPTFRVTGGTSSPTLKRRQRASGRPLLGWSMCATSRAIRGRRSTIPRSSSAKPRCRSIGPCRRISGGVCVDELDKRCTEEGESTGDSKSGVQWRIVRAALLLMGDSGLRREEAADAQRGKLRVSIYGTLERPVWE